MKNKMIETKFINVSPIIQIFLEDGRDYLGFTVYYDENRFYNVMRKFSVDDFEQVFEALTEERRQILLNGKTKEKL